MRADLRNASKGKGPNLIARALALPAALALAALFTGCALGPAETGSFDRALSVTGPVRLELQNGSGGVHITTGDPGQVRIHADVRAHAWLFSNPRSQLDDITQHPPIEQRGNLIHLGFDKYHLRSVSITYTIVVPAQTEVQATIGSGGLELRGIKGPADFTLGSGSIAADDIHDAVQVRAGSGGIRLSNIAGDVRAVTGSGGITLTQVRGDIRATAGSGGITIDQPGGRINAKTGSGGVTVNGASEDLRASAGSGHLTIVGNPERNSYWELRTGSGGVSIGVPPTASFRFYAHSGSGGIQTSLPAVIEERGRHELRARIGDGAARVEIRTGSGNIQIH